jgi:hypothetical protein
MKRVLTKSHSAVTAIFLVTILLVGLVLYGHVTAGNALGRSHDASLSLQQRLASAREARRLEPWRPAARSQAALLEGTILVQQNDLDAAKRVLKAAYLQDRGNVELRALLADVNRQIEVRDARKAHQQHGHEGPGGSLAPEDVEH